MRTGAPGSFVKSRLTTKECLLPIFKSPKERNKWKESMYKRKVGYITCRHIFATDKGSVCVCVCVCVCVFSHGGSNGKESACNVGDPDSIPGLGRSPGEGNGNPLQSSCLENPVDGGARQAPIHWVTKSWTQLSN